MFNNIDDILFMAIFLNLILLTLRIENIKDEIKKIKGESNG